MKKLISFALVLMCNGSLQAGNATLWSVDSQKSELTFLAIGSPGFLKIRGEKAVLQGTMQINAGRLQGQFETVMDTFVTSVDLRDRHMREKHFETNRFPKASLTVDEMAVPAVGKEVDFTGQLTLKGVQKPIKGLLTVEKSDDKNFLGDANFSVKLSDFPSLGVPKYLGITVAEDVRVTVKVVAARKD